MGPQFLVHDRKIEKERDDSFISQHCRYLPSVGIYSSLSYFVCFPICTPRNQIQTILCGLGFILSCSICLPQTHNFRLAHSFPLEWEEGDKKSSQMDPQTASNPVWSLSGFNSCLPTTPLSPPHQSAFSGFHLGKAEKETNKQNKSVFLQAGFYNRWKL